MKNSRVTAVELNTNQNKILLINAYIPFFTTNNMTDKLNEYRDTVAFIENLMSCNPNHHYIISMDMNCNIFGPRNSYSDLIHEMMSEFNLVSNFDFMPDFDPSKDYTRFDTKRNSYTLIDGILISQSLSNIVESSCIIHPADNVSDHLPVEITINIDVCDTPHKPSPISNYIPWSSLTDVEISSYRSTMLNALNQISLPVHALNHGYNSCNDGDCLIALEEFYSNIVIAVETADKNLPRKKHGLAKPFWSKELTCLKQKSYDANNVWKSCGRPRNGPIHEEKI